ncbi:MBL fold metallo-hydrolase [Apilactobacillus apisilvae]|uniref:MBL fold metallo-hydrolase n=1 Tax=Apilactobacillus apisilvae TaxID=2923364 RepID=A0ABY4PJD9_9LACO|nr:MBL fold metallo-hydrolase [Apilactobacillus apisilvae]UQS85561.1 MBL fold metallo-hydrolase [Apilactobacillus apisilvae]
MKVRVLGYYGGYPYDGVGTSGYLIQSGNFNLLLDCGSGVLLELEKYLDPLQLDALILSHYHHDHKADVGVLEYYWQLNKENRKEPTLPIYGNTDDEYSFEGLNWNNDTKAMPYNENKKLNLDPFTITFLKTKHPVPSYAVKILEKSTKKTLVFTSDTKYFDGLVDFCSDADILITDTNFYEDKKGIKWHMTSKETGKLIRDSKAKCVIISHLPQYGVLSDLLNETVKYSGNKSNIMLAKLGLMLDIN